MNLALTSLSFRQNSCVGKGHQHGALGVAYPKFAFQTPNNIFCLFALTCSKEFRNDRHFLALGLRSTCLTFCQSRDDRPAHRVAGTECDFFEVRENEGHSEGPWLEQRLLHVLGVLREHIRRLARDDV